MNQKIRWARLHPLQFELRNHRWQVYAQLFVIDDKQCDVTPALFRVDRAIGGEAQEWLSRNYAFMHVRMKGVEQFLGVFHGMFPAIKGSRNCGVHPITTYQRYNMQLSICSSKDEDTGLGFAHVMLIGQAQIIRFCRLLACRYKANHGKPSPQRSDFRYSLVSLPWSTDIDLQQRMERCILEDVAECWFHLDHVSVTGVTDQKLADNTRERLSGARWASALELFAEFDRIQLEETLLATASEYEAAEFLSLYLTDLEQLIEAGGDRLHFTVV